MSWHRFPHIPWFKSDAKPEQPVSVTKDNYYSQAPVSRLHQEVNRLFDDFFKDFSPAFLGQSVSGSQPWIAPKIDISETEEKYQVAVEVPGIAKEDIDIKVHNDTLIIKGEKKDSREEANDEKYHLVERTYGNFQRVLALPSEVDQDNIGANFKDGVLLLTLPKREDAEVGKKQIEIH